MLNLMNICGLSQESEDEVSGCRPIQGRFLNLMDLCGLGDEDLDLGKFKLGKSFKRIASIATKIANPLHAVQSKLISKLPKGMRKIATGFSAASSPAFARGWINEQVNQKITGVVTDKASETLPPKAGFPAGK